MAVFDVVVNNADRKGGHVLAMPDGHRYGVDHGVSFHTDDKLRTVLWGWVGEALTPEEVAAVAEVCATGSAATSAATLGPLLERVRDPGPRTPLQPPAGHAACCPSPHGDWPSIPWPPF